MTGIKDYLTLPITVLGAITAVGTLAAGVLTDASVQALKVAGALYLLLGMGLTIRDPMEEKLVWRWGFRALAVGVLVFAATEMFPWDDQTTIIKASLIAFGGFGIVTSTYLVIEVLVARHREAHKSCPDCAETVKVDAMVCRYCGHRFTPQPLGGIFGTPSTSR